MAELVHLRLERPSDSGLAEACWAWAVLYRDVLLWHADVYLEHLS